MVAACLRKSRLSAGGRYPKDGPDWRNGCSGCRAMPPSRISVSSSPRPGRPMRSRRAEVTESSTCSSRPSGSETAPNLTGRGDRLPQAPAGLRRSPSADRPRDLDRARVCLPWPPDDPLGRRADPVHRVHRSRLRGGRRAPQQLSQRMPSGLSAEPSNWSPGESR